MNLAALGFSEFFARQHRQCEATGVAARVTRVSGWKCELRTEEGGLVAHIPQRIRKARSRSPVVGDWVLVDLEGVEPQVTHVFERRTRVARRAAGRRTEVQLIAANVDVVWVVTGLDGDFNIRRIERYLTVVADSGARAAVLLTKAAVCADVAEKTASAQSVSIGVPVHALDVLAGHNTESLDAYLVSGQTIGLVGSSGAGKSTIINHLLSAPTMATAEVRSGDDRGRHTTTHRELFWLPSGAAVIDNPGMREVQLWVDGDALDEAFPDVKDAARACRFNDCTHTREPGCAVRDAVEEGSLDGRRLQSYQDLQADIEGDARRRNEHERRAGERAFGKMVREAKRLKRRKG
jgi:ribosome biogenesis GTPase